MLTCGLILGDKVSIATLYGETEDEISEAIAGDQVRIRLRGVEEEDILPGFVLCSPSSPVGTDHTSATGDVELRSLCRCMLSLRLKRRSSCWSFARFFRLDSIVCFMCIAVSMICSVG